MTRVTDFGRKRKYVETGFNAGQTATSSYTPPNQEEIDVDGSRETEEPAGHPKKKHKWLKKINASNTVEDLVKSNGDDNDVTSDPEGDSGQVSGAFEGKKRKRKNKNGDGKSQQDAANRSERRRQNRIAERNADTTCFACRETGHAAKDCPVAKGGGKGSAVGICYRCGSTRHKLSRCKKPVDAQNPLPFASCFVCSDKGHLASACPQKEQKGIYPNGGCCKLCGDTMHLAKDCKLEDGSSNPNSHTQRNVGADEDDFLVSNNSTRVVGLKKWTDKTHSRSQGSREQLSKVFTQAKRVVYF